MDRKRKSFGFSGFRVASKSSDLSSSVDKDSSTNSRRIHDAEMEASGSLQYGTNRKWYMDDDESLEDDGESAEAPSRRSSNQEDDEDDPLDSFMAGIEAQARKDKEVSEKKAVMEPPSEKKKTALGRTDIEDEDEQESYFKWVEENKEKLERSSDNEEDDVEYDEEGNPIVSHKKIMQLPFGFTIFLSKVIWNLLLVQRNKRSLHSHIDPLKRIDHSMISYEPFEKNFYSEHSDISQLSQDQVNGLRKKLDIKVIGANPPKPVSSFAHFGFDSKLMAAIRKAEYSVPTPIQAQGIPVILSGRDIIGIAKTGSGKTVAYLWPALVHIMGQRELLDGEGPICLILAPARELAIQIYNEAKKFAKVYDLRVVCAYGGGSKWEQSKALEVGSDIVVGTPGRIIDMVNMEAMDLNRVTYLVLDEADRMFDMGFEPQVRSIADHVRPDRQCMLFSATFKKKIEHLARDVLTNPVKVIQGELGEANEDIEQEVIVLPSGPSKYAWLLERLVSFCTLGKVLIFVNQKQHVEELANNLKAKDFSVCVLHGDMLQHERNEVNHAFRKNVPILVATDVAARGLDILAIKTVVNYDAAKDLDTHIHRIGRTGRAGEKGWAYTLLTEKDKEFAGHLVKNLNSLNQEVPPKLLELALQVGYRVSKFLMASISFLYVLKFSLIK
ncbi:unnamed protein product [Soboliphyme baturini]|uniref:RNA helicase n=1 Tax=Soboliphyme baturini TaxID=241478 RepID=A0A183IFN0_9BILA|nr:unnamed protein product [Soboliphyme baturini]